MLFNKLLALFGYSTLFYVPASILAVLPFGFWQFIVFLAGFGASSFLLFKNLLKISKIGNEVAGLILLGSAIGINFMFAITMKIKFYYS